MWAVFCSLPRVPNNKTSFASLTGVGKDELGWGGGKGERVWRVKCLKFEN